MSTKYTNYTLPVEHCSFSDTIICGWPGCADRPSSRASHCVSLTQGEPDPEPEAVSTYHTSLCRGQEDAFLSLPVKHSRGNVFVLQTEFTPGQKQSEQVLKRHSKWSKLSHPPREEGRSSQTIMASSASSVCLTRLALPRLFLLSTFRQSMVVSFLEQAPTFLENVLAHNSVCDG